MRIDMARPRSVVGWTMLAGAVAGLLAAVYFSIAGEPAIEDAIAIEEAASHVGDGHADDGGHAHEDGPVDRGTQRGAGLFGAYALTGAAFGLLLALAVLTLRGPWLDPFRRYLVGGAVLAGAVTVAPWLKYPPNPPAVGDPDTVGGRQLTYWLLVLVTAAVLAGVAHLSGRLRQAGWSAPPRVAACSATAVVAVGVLLALMPASSVAIPPEVPASLVWRFRIAALVGNLLLWGLLAVGTGLVYSVVRSREAEPTRDQNSMPFRADSPLS